MIDGPKRQLIDIFSAYACDNGRKELPDSYTTASKVSNSVYGRWLSRIVDTKKRHATVGISLAAVHPSLGHRKFEVSYQR